MNINNDKAIKYILSEIHQDKGEGSFHEWLNELGLLDKQPRTREKKIKVRQVEGSRRRCDNVSLTEREIQSLKEYYTDSEIDKIYDKLFYYKQSKAKTYKSDYAAMNTWAIEAALGMKREKPLPKKIQHFNEEEEE